MVMMMTMMMMMISTIITIIIIIVIIIIMRLQSAFRTFYRFAFDLFLILNHFAF